MESPFFRSNWSNFPPRSVYSPSVRQVPFQRQAKPAPTPKVVSIPVRFVSSERTTSDSALKIQKAVRGFLVRKSLKKIALIGRQVDGIDERISKPETVELIRKDSAERLRVNETLMNLLLRLDSVRGVDSGVRECRKAVIKKAITLQERVDSIVAGDQASGGDAIDEASEADQATDTKDVDEVSERVDDSKAAENASELQLEAPEAERSSTSSAIAERSNSSEVEDSANEAAKVCTMEPQDQEKTPCDPKITEEALDLQDENQENVASIENEESIGDPNEERLGTNCETESQCGSSPNPPSLIEGEEENTLAKENDGMEMVQDGRNKEKAEENFTVGAGDNTKKNKVLLERMMEDNERMMGLMTELFEKNEMQTRLLSSLSQRVEQLERAFVCDKLMKKKKRRASGTVDCFEKSHDSTKKCGNR